MKHSRFLAFVFLATLAFSACSNLFENVLTIELKAKTGDDSLKDLTGSGGAAINYGLVVIKNSEQNVNQISYTSTQNVYFVGTVPDEYEDITVNYKNGSKTNLLGKDDPVEFRCYANDANASVTWTISQTWEYVPTESTKSYYDNDGTEVVYRGITGQTANKLASEKSVSYVVLNGDSTDSIIQADLPYGVSVVTCEILADDTSYSSKYTIVLTKKYVTTIASSSTDSDVDNENNVTNHGLVVVKASDPGRNAINYSSTTYEYEVGDSTGVDTSLDLTGRDDPVVFKCFILDENAKLTWSAKYIKKYIPVLDSNSGGIISQSLQKLDNPLTFDFIEASDSYTGTNPFMQYVSDDSKEVLQSDLPYGVTEVYATITGYNEDSEGNLVSYVTQYKVTLTKRYIITSASSSSSEADSGLVVLVSGNSGNQISYRKTTLDYTVDNLTGANENCTIKFYPEEALFTNLTWTALQVQTYESTIVTEESSNDVTYTLQTGDFTDLSTPVNLISGETLTISKLDDGSMCAGNLPYGTTKVTVTAASTADSNSATTYTITFKKKRVATNLDIQTASGETISTVTNRGLVVLSAADSYATNRIGYTGISYATNKIFALTQITAADNGEDGMKFRCYLADSDASIKWTAYQTKTFTAVTTTKEETDSFTGETIKTTYLTGQSEKDCYISLDYASTSDGSNNEITLIVPYGVTQVKATISATNESTTVYTINLTRNIYTSSSSSSESDDEDSGNYSLLEDLDVTIQSGSSESSAKLDPEFDPKTTVYNIEVDEEADSLCIEAIAQAVGAEISDAKVITKYGTVPGCDGMSVALVGGTSRISFSVTDESGISRTYYIYVEKPADGDTSLASLDYTPGASFANGVKGFTFNSSYAGGSESSAAPYSMTLSADDRVDVTSLVFSAVPNNKRTTTYYGISSSATVLPTEWSTGFKKANPESTTVEAGNKVLWIKTVSDLYYHKTSSGYESEKTADTTYHKIAMTKATDDSTKLTAMVVIATYEDGSTKEVLRQVTSSEVAYKVSGTTVGSGKITTFADKLDFYFRPLDKDQAVYYTAKNTTYTNSTENTTFVGYASSALSLSKTSGTCSYLNDSSSGYYHFTLGEVVGGTASTSDLPNGTTKVTICGETYYFVKPDLSTVSYSVTAGSGTGSGVEKLWEYYIYLDNSVESINMNFTTTQQNESLSVLSCQQTAASDGGTIAAADAQNADWSLFHYDTESGFNIVKWQLCVGNAPSTLDNYKWNSDSRESNSLTTILPEGTTTLVLRVSNGGSEGTTTRDYTFYIIRSSDIESRLNKLYFGTKTPSAFQTDWANGMEGSDFYYSVSPSSTSTTYAVDAGSFKLSAEAVSEKASISVTKYHSNTVSVSATADGYNAAIWDSGETFAEDTGAISQNYTFSSDDAGTVLFKVTVQSADKGTNGEYSVRNYYLFIYVEADKTAQLDSLRIVQKGTSETSADEDSEDRIILGNSFKSGTFDYTDLSASLNYIGDIVITPEKYSKATITEASLTLNGIDVVVAAYASESNYIFTIPYESYIAQMGKTYVVTYTVQAQDASVDPVTYTAEFKIPTYTVVTETKTFTSTTNYSYEIPSGYSKGLGYRFGSLIADTSSKLCGFFGGIDIVGSSTINKSSPVWYESSFGASGLQFIVDVDGTSYGIGLNASGVAEKFYKIDSSSLTVTECSNDDADVPAVPAIELTVKPKFVYEDTEPYLQLTFELTNSSGKYVKLGAVIDTLVGTLAESTNADNDSVEVESTNNGFTMNGSAYNFAVVLKNAYGVDDVDNIWYGAYNSGNFISNVFDSTATSILPTGEDSAATFSWDLGSDASYEKTIRFTMKSIQ